MKHFTAQFKHKTILIVGDRASVEPKLKAMGIKDIRIVDPDGKVK